MTKCIIIGNGFDLNLGLKTSYRDFMESSQFLSLIGNRSHLALQLKKAECLVNWVDIENELTRYSNLPIHYSTTRKVDVKICFYQLKRALINYLLEAQESEIDSNSHAYRMSQDEFDSTDRIFNFNYTNSVFRILMEGGAEKKIVDNKHSYVHGSIENGDMIIGVQDDAKIDAAHIYLRKASHQNFGQSQLYKKLKEDIDLVFFGHPLGVTDKSYFENYFYSL